MILGSLSTVCTTKERRLVYTVRDTFIYLQLALTWQLPRHQNGQEQDWNSNEFISLQFFVFFSSEEVAKLALHTNQPPHWVICPVHISVTLQEETAVCGMETAHKMLELLAPDLNNPLAVS